MYSLISLACRVCLLRICSNNLKFVNACSTASIDSRASVQEGEIPNRCMQLCQWLVDVFQRSMLALKFT